MSLIKVKVVDTHVTNRSGVSKLGKSYSINSQDNIFIELNGEVRKIPVNLSDGVSPYSPGNYTLDPTPLLRLDKFNRLEVDPFFEIKLVPAVSSEPVSQTAQVEPIKADQPKLDLKSMMAGRS